MKKRVWAILLLLVLAITLSTFTWAANDHGELTGQIEQREDGPYLVCTYISGNNSIKAAVFEVLTPDGGTVLLESPIVPFTGKTGSYAFKLTIDIPENAIIRLTEDKKNKPVIINGVFAEGFSTVCDHTPGDPADCVNNQVCLDCGEILDGATGHTAGAAATCTTAQVCTVCGDELVAVLGHTPGAEATCEDAQVCTVCGDEIEPALGHDICEGGCGKCLRCEACVCGDINKSKKPTTPYDGGGNIPTGQIGNRSGNPITVSVPVTFTLGNGETVTLPAVVFTISGTGARTNQQTVTVNGETFTIQLSCTITPPDGGGGNPKNVSNVSVTFV